MRQGLLDLISWGTQAIQAAQTFQHPALDLFFHAVTWLGNETGYLVLFPLLFWCIDASLGRRIGLLLFASLYLNAAAKAFFAIPRPDPTLVRLLVTEDSFSWPSGHAQGSFTFWGYLAWVWRSWTWRLAVAFALLLMGFSRLYLGVHFPQDILGGWLLGLAILALGIALETPFLRLFLRWPLAFRATVALASPLLLWAFWPHPSLAGLAGLWSGLALGIVLERSLLGFEASGSLSQRALRLLGLLPLVGIWLGLKLLLPSGSFFSIMRYFLVGFAGCFLLPWLFLRLRSRRPNGGPCPPAPPHKGLEAP